eukprot:CAMPEP_0116894878 /NCGR_PEP_ID=MMETSP0467-20121206/4541_1 /TAXON_ID=283647 /ORGANISM="Mesodinium pulex, Strain SPMC105" /LENGTH=74 /DNA_ID=CAMNT_0004565327 /DNA_START=432 /DNA_END=656 /DNA_ORIENTATION=+
MSEATTHDSSNIENGNLINLQNNLNSSDYTAMVNDPYNFDYSKLTQDQQNKNNQQSGNPDKTDKTDKMDKNKKI